jgi:hypothetical protein
MSLLPLSINTTSFFQRLLKYKLGKYHGTELKTRIFEKYNPEIKIIIPATFYPEGLHLIRGAEFITPGASNRIPHQDQLVQLQVSQHSVESI